MKHLWILPILLLSLFARPAPIQAGEPAIPIELNETVTGDLDDTVAFYKLTLETTNILNLSLTSDDFDPLLTVNSLDSNQELITVDDAQGTLDAIATDVFAEAGEYQIVVSSSDGTGRGTYTLSVTSTIAGVVEIGDSVSGRIANDADIHHYLITLETDDYIVISVDGEGVDVNVELLDGIQIGSLYAIISDYDSGQFNDALLGPFHPSYDQTFIISVFGYIYEESGGEYTLSVEAVDSAPIACGETVEGSLAAGSSGAYYSMDLNAGAILNVYADGLERFDPALVVYTPDTYLMADDDDGGLGRDAELSNLSTWESGTYTIGVRAYELAGAGDYILTVECRLPLPISEEPLTVVSDIKTGFTVFLVGDVKSGDTFDLVVDGLDNSIAYVYIDGVWNATIEGTYRADQSGLMTIMVYPNITQEVEYQVSIVKG